MEKPSVSLLELHKCIGGKVERTLKTNSNVLHIACRVLKPKLSHSNTVLWTAFFEMSEIMKNCEYPN